MFSIREKIRKKIKACHDALEWPDKVAFFETEYDNAKKFYSLEESPHQSTFRNPADLGLHCLIPGEEHNGPFVMPPNHREYVEKVSQAASKLFSESKNVMFRTLSKELNKDIEEEAKHTQLSEGLTAVKKGEVYKLFLKNVTTLSSFSALIDPLIAQAERQYYHSFVWLEKAVIYRSIGNKYPEKKSTLWHSDNHYESISKIMIYLTDVGKKDAPFEYLRHKLTGEVPRIKANMPPFYPGSRVPKEVIETYVKKGYERVKILGPKGTVIFFDDKIIHKGNEPEEGHVRDAMVLQLRPCAIRPRSYVVEGQTSSI